MKKGLRPNDEVPPAVRLKVRNAALMKKGLRLIYIQRYDSRYRSERSPDEEGIKTYDTF